jgi:ribulose-5-phosphate 4-epimerase/fuculose-1-phosphate aldolase
MKAKPGINAITRIHARVANMFSVTERKLEPVHNHGSFFAGGVPVFYKPDLITTQKLGEEVVQTIRDSPAVLLRGNGQVTVGRTIPEAVMMAIYLEEAAEILYGALQIGTPVPLTADESAKRQVEALPPVDLERAWNFFKKSAARVKQTRT